MTRRLLNLSAAVLIALALPFTFSSDGLETNEAVAGGGTCCDQDGATCYIVEGHVVIQQPDAYYSEGAC